MVCHANQWPSPVDDDGCAANAKCQCLADGVELSGRAPKIYRPPDSQSGRLLGAADRRGTSWPAVAGGDEGEAASPGADASSFETDQGLHATEASRICRKP